MFELFSKGYLLSCPAPNDRCRCEATMLMVVALLALFAGGTQAVLGYYFSVAVLSDSVHALADAGADLFGAYIALRVLAIPLDEERLSFVSNKVVAGFIVVASGLIAIEAMERWFGNEYIVFPFVALLAGSIGYWIDTTRVRILRKAKIHYASPRIDGYIDHARTDAKHSKWVAIIGGVAFGFQLLTEFLFFVGFSLISKDLYDPFIRLLDFGAAVYISIWMMKVGYNRWSGSGHDHSHSHSDNDKKCDHKH